ncbi:hypothetical protein R5R35_012689 [Gryllus longicercus]|uniref:Uncharacterized protein n=1 Tax=Gryllus longicercus TaxID=2509291 RepID=A0AAN9VIP8_9ORTH
MPGAAQPFRRQSHPPTPRGGEVQVLWRSTGALPVTRRPQLRGNFQPGFSHAKNGETLARLKPRWEQLRLKTRWIRDFLQAPGT